MKITTYQKFVGHSYGSCQRETVALNAYISTEEKLQTHQASSPPSTRRGLRQAQGGRKEGNEEQKSTEKMDQKATTLQRNQEN